jgi:hypothetical protein
MHAGSQNLPSSSPRVKSSIHCQRPARLGFRWLDSGRNRPLQTLSVIPTIAQATDTRHGTGNGVDP